MVTTMPDARISLARATALSSSGRVTARVEIFSAKIRVTPAARRESTCGVERLPDGGGAGVPDAHAPGRHGPGRAGRGSLAQAKPGLCSGGTGR